MAVKRTLSGDELLERTIYQEAGNQGLTGLALVALSIFNRQKIIDSGKPPGTFNAKSSSLYDILTGSNQYQPVKNGWVKAIPNKKQESRVREAIKLAQNPEQLEKELRKEDPSLSDDQLVKLLNSTGFRTSSARKDPSQEFNMVQHKDHIFNTAGNDNVLIGGSKEDIPPPPLPEAEARPEVEIVEDYEYLDNAGPDAVLSDTSIPSEPAPEKRQDVVIPRTISPEEKQTIVSRTMPTDDAARIAQADADRKVGPGYDLAQTDADRTIDKQMSELIPPGAGGTRRAKTREEEQLDPRYQPTPGRFGYRELIPPVDDPNVENLDFVDQTTAAKEAQRLENLKGKYTTDELRTRPELGLTEPQIQELAIPSEIDADTFDDMDWEEDKPLGEMLTTFFNSWEVTPSEDLDYAGPDAMDEGASFDKGGLVDRLSTLTKNPLDRRVTSDVRNSIAEMLGIKQTAEDARSTARKTADKQNWLDNDRSEDTLRHILGAGYLKFEDKEGSQFPLNMTERIDWVQVQIDRLLNTEEEDSYTKKYYDQSLKEADIDLINYKVGAALARKFNDNDKAGFTAAAIKLVQDLQAGKEPKVEYEMPTRFGIRKNTITPQLSTGIVARPEQSRMMAENFSEDPPLPEPRPSPPLPEPRPKNFEHGGPVERDLEITKNGNEEVEEEDEDLPDPPPGATPEEVADDVPAYLSTGEYVLPANVVRYIGLRKIKDMHIQALCELQQMTDLGIIQNVDHEGKPEDDDDEMPYINHPKALLNKVSSQFISVRPQGLMEPLRLYSGGEAGSDPMSEDDTDTFTSPEATGSGMSGPESDAVTKGLVKEFGTGAESRLERFKKGYMPPDEKAAYLASRTALVLDSLAQFGKDFTEALEKAGITVEGPTDLQDVSKEERDREKAQGYTGFSGFGIDKEIGDTGETQDDSDAPVETTEETSPITTGVRDKDGPSFVSGVGFVDKDDSIPFASGGNIVRKGIMRAATGAYVPGVGILESVSTGDTDQGSFVSEIPNSFEDFKQKAFGTALFPDTGTGNFSDAVRAKVLEYKTNPQFTGQQLEERQDSFRELVGPKWNVNTANDDLRNTKVAEILRKAGVDDSMFGSVMDAYRSGRNDILSAGGISNAARKNESVKQQFGQLAFQNRVLREGINQDDIQEGQTNRDVLTQIFGFHVAHQDDLHPKNAPKTQRINNLLFGEISDRVAQDKGYDLNAEANVEDINRIGSFIQGGSYKKDGTGLGTEFRRQQEASAGTGTSGMMSPSGSFVPGVGFV
jgi:hypothetical protein